MNFLDTVPLVATVRRNHGLEHATIHVLSERVKQLAVMGHATLEGFNLIGDVPTEAIEAAAQEALKRLRAGQHRMVIHPNCGTNFVTMGFAAGLAAWAASFGRGTISKLPRIIMVSTLALLFAMPVGLLVQEHITTSPMVGDAQILGVERIQRGNMTVHRVRIG
jgi:hypothetical protein